MSPLNTNTESYVGAVEFCFRFDDWATLKCQFQRKVWNVV